MKLIKIAKEIEVYKRLYKPIKDKIGNDLIVKIYDRIFLKVRMRITEQIHTNIRNKIYEINKRTSF